MPDLGATGAQAAFEDAVSNSDLPAVDVPQLQISAPPSTYAPLPLFEDTLFDFMSPLNGMEKATSPPAQDEAAAVPSVSAEAQDFPALPVEDAGPLSTPDLSHKLSAPQLSSNEALDGGQDLAQEGLNAEDDDPDHDVPVAMSPEKVALLKAMTQGTETDSSSTPSTKQSSKKRSRAPEPEESVASKRRKEAPVAITKKATKKASTAKKAIPQPESLMDEDFVIPNRPRPSRGSRKIASTNKKNTPTERSSLFVNAASAVVDGPFTAYPRPLPPTAEPVNKALLNNPYLKSVLAKPVLIGPNIAVPSTPTPIAEPASEMSPPPRPQLQSPVTPSAITTPVITTLKSSSRKLPSIDELLEVRGYLIERFENLVEEKNNEGVILAGRERDKLFNRTARVPNLFIETHLKGIAGFKSECEAWDTAMNHRQILQRRDFFKAKIDEIDKMIFKVEAQEEAKVAAERNGQMSA